MTHGNEHSGTQQDYSLEALVRKDWETFSLEEQLRRITAAQQTGFKDKDEALAESHEHLAALCLELANAASHQSRKVSLIGQAKRHRAHARRARQMRVPQLVGHEARAAISEAAECLLLPAFTAAMNSASYIKGNAGLLSEAIAEGSWRAAMTFTPDYGVKPNFWAYAVTTMVMREIADRENGQTTSSDPVTQQLKRQIGYIREALELENSPELPNTERQWGGVLGPRPDDIWADNRSKWEIARDEARRLAETEGEHSEQRDVAATLMSGTGTVAATEEEQVSKRIAIARGMSGRLRGQGAIGELLAETALTSASYLQERVKQGDSRSVALHGLATITDEELVRRTQDSMTKRGYLVSLTQIEAAVMFMRHGGYHTALESVETNEVLPHVDRAAPSLQSTRRRANRVTHRIGDPAFIKGARRAHPHGELGKYLKEVLGTWASDDEWAMTLAAITEDVRDPSHIWNAHSGSAWEMHLQQMKQASEPAEVDRVLTTVGSVPASCAALENITPKDHRIKLHQPENTTRLRRATTRRQSQVRGNGNRRRAVPAAQPTTPLSSEMTTQLDNINFS